MATVASAADARWQGAIAVLEEVRRAPGATRAAVAQRLRLRSGSATDITARLRDLALVAETPAPVRGRGRPTTVLGPHPDGPLVVAVDVRQEDWRCAVAALDGVPEIVVTASHTSREPGPVLDSVRRAVARIHDRYGQRIRAVGVAVAGTVRRGRVVQAASLGWGAVEVGELVPDVPVVVDNDATLAGVAEARYGAAAGASSALHLTVEVGLGGTLVVDGHPVRGATGAGGEFGHLPFGDCGLRCPCGALGCWDMTVDGRALARHLGDPPPRDPRTYALTVLERAEREPAARNAVDVASASLAAGIAGLVNALDPEVVTLGGLAEPLSRATPFAMVLTDGLMAFRRAEPPPVLAAELGDEGALYGAATVALDRVLDADGLAAWASLRCGPSSAEAPGAMG